MKLYSEIDGWRDASYINGGWLSPYLPEYSSCLADFPGVWFRDVIIKQYLDTPTFSIRFRSDLDSDRWDEGWGVSNIRFELTDMPVTYLEY